MFTVKINGKRHVVTVSRTGEKVFDPPIPESDQVRYEKRLKDMVDSGIAPGSVTDTSFHAGRGGLAQQLNGDVNWAKFITNRAKGYGYTPGPSDVYISQLVRTEYGPGDPQAWVPPSEGRGLIEKRCRERGLYCTGSVKVDEDKLG